MRFIQNSLQITLKIFFFSSFFYSQAFAAPTVAVEPKTQNVYSGLKATVKITTTEAIKCTVSGDTYNKNNIILNGNVLLSPTKSVNYLFECTGQDGTKVSTNAQVSVLQKNGTVTAQAQATTPNVNQTQTSPTQTTQRPATASQAPQIQYPTQTTQTEAQNICQQYSGFQSVYGDVSGGGSNGSVPVDLTNLAPYLISINRNAQLTANEMRAGDMIRFCRIMPNIAAASARLAQESSKQLKTIADECTADEKCYLQRVYKYDVEQGVKYAQSLPVVGQNIAQLFAKVSQGKRDTSADYDPDLLEKCNQALETHTPIECMGVPLTEQAIKSNVQKIQNGISTNQLIIQTEFQNNGGVIASRPCTKTFSGKDPKGVFYKDPDCADYKIQPAIINQEVLKQIAALPYTQAYSQASELGVDQAINNISTRIQNGNLVDPDVSTGFGSISGGGGNPTGGGGSIGNGTDMSSVAPNYNKILTNIKVINTLYDVARAAYASSTSVCKSIPVQTRSQTIARVDSAKKSYTDYATALTNQWNQAVKTPNENHLNLVTQINFDLKDKYNQDLINKVYDAVKALLQSCVDASSRATS